MKRKKDVKGEKDRKQKKIKVEQTKPQKQKFVHPRLPKTAEDISANWKAFSALLSEKKKKEDKNNASSKGRRKNLLNHKTKGKGRHLVDNTAVKSKSDEIWFDDVDPEDIIRASGSTEQQTVQKKQTMSESNTGHQFQLIKGGYEGLTKHVAMDCEMVGVGINGEEHMLARVSIVNTHGHVIYDKYVAPQEKVIDYRTAVSGIRPENIKNAPAFKSVQQEVFDILDKKVLVGHAIQNDLKVLFLDHPHRNIRDTSKYKPFQKAVKSKKPSLKKLAKFILGMDIQSGEHCSVQDAQVTMRLYCMHKKDWERKLKEKRLKRSRAKQENSNPSDLSKSVDY